MKGGVVKLADEVIKRFSPCNCYSTMSSEMSRSAVEVILLCRSVGVPFKKGVEGANGDESGGECGGGLLLACGLVGDDDA